MRRIIAFFVLVGLVALGYYFYTQSQRTSSAPVSRLKITQAPYQFDSLSKVLGTTTTKVIDTTTNLLNGVTDGQAEPLINKTLENLQNEVKDLPREQYEKVKYEFCKDVVTKYESPSPLPSVSNE